MVSVFTPNLQLEEPAAGDQVGTWDVPVNSNETIIDLVVGGITTQPLNNTNVVLLSSQYMNKTIVFNSTLTGSVTITFPTSFTKSYEVANLCTGTSAFTVTLKTTAAGGQVVACPPTGSVTVVNDGTHFRFHNLGRIGTYWDYGGSSLPSWVAGCTVQPYLNCDGTSFSSATYPALAVIRAGVTLPDTRGRSRFSLNAGTSRITTAGSSVNGDSLAGAGGSEFLQSHTHVNTLSAPTHTHTATVLSYGNNINTGPLFDRTGNGGNNSGSGTVTVSVVSHVSGITITNAAFGTGATQNMPTAYVGGLTLVRAG